MSKAKRKTNKKDTDFQPMEIEVVLSIKQPNYELEPLKPGSEEAQMMIDVRHDLVLMADAGYAVFANMVNTRDLVGQDGGPPKVLSVVKPSLSIEFTLGFNFSVIKRLSHSARKELLKFELLRIPYGHFSQRTQAMVARYGLEVTERAGQMVLSQLINSAILAEEDIVLPVPELYDFERNLTMEDYANKLWEKGGGAGQMPTIVKIIINKPNGEAADIGSKVKDTELQKDLDDLADGNGLTRVDSLDSSAGYEGKDMDSFTKSFLNSASQALNSIDQSLKNQGFMSGYAEEFIRSLDRKATLKLRSYIQRMHTIYANPYERIATPKRLSRRSPITPLPDGKFTKYYWGNKPGKQPVVLVWVDTSGSMSSKELEIVRPELVGLINLGAKVLVGQIDAGIAKQPIEFTKAHPFDTFSGRGGTDFRPAFEYSQSMKLRPSYLIYITDGYGTAPAEESFIPTLWVLTSSGKSVIDFQSSVCNWGEVLVLEVEGD